jgi:hypothetical protein
MKNTTRRTSIILLLLALLVPLRFASAQDETGSLTLNLRRDFGFSMGGQIQGSFTLSASGPADLRSVDFMIDDTLVFHDADSPFEFKFHTSDYSLGVHTIQAVGSTAGGASLQSKVLRFEFVSAEQGWKSASVIIIPLFILIVVIGVAGVLASSLFGRKKEFHLGEYGAAGGAVCSRCGLPFSRHVFSLNVFFGKLERCPHCGKLGLVRLATPSELTQAEARYQADRKQGRIEPQDDKTKRERLIDESRFEDQ